MQPVRTSQTRRGPRSHSDPSRSINIPCSNVLAVPTGTSSQDSNECDETGSIRSGNEKASISYHIFKNAPWATDPTAAHYVAAGTSTNQLLPPRRVVRTWVAEFSPLKKTRKGRLPVSRAAISHLSQDAAPPGLSVRSAAP